MKRPVFIPKIILLSILLSLSLSHPFLIYGQQSTVRGVVTDQEGNPIKDAKITFQGRGFDPRTEKTN